MRKLSEIKLGQLNKVELSERELNRLLGEVTVVSVIIEEVLLFKMNYDANIKGGVSGLIPGDGGYGVPNGSFS